MSEEKWCRRIVFKENVHSVFGLGVDLTEPLGSEAAEEFLRFMAGVVLNTGSEIVEDISPFGDIAAAPVKYIAGKIKKMPEPKLVASGMIDLSTDDIPVKGIKCVTVPLNASRNVVKRSRRTINKKTKVTTKVLLKKGVPNGELTFAIKRI